MLPLGSSTRRLFFLFIAGFSCWVMAGCGEPAKKSLPFTVTPRGYAIFSPEWPIQQVPVCDLLLVSRSQDDLPVWVEVTRPNVGRVYRKSLRVPHKGRLHVTGNLQSASFNELQRSGHIQPGDTVEITNDDFQPLIIPIPPASELDILYLSPANGLKDEPTR